MGTEIFPIVAGRPYIGEGAAHKTTVHTAQGGRTVAAAEWPTDGLFRVRKALLTFSPGDYATFCDFFDAVRGRYDTFLYLPVLQRWRTVTDEALGTATGGTESFALDSKHIKASTIVVKVGGVDQSGDWSLSGNNTAPMVDGGAGFDAGTVTATYDRYIPCRFDQDDFDPDVKKPGTTDADAVMKVTSLTWRQNRPGSHLV